MGKTLLKLFIVAASVVVALFIFRGYLPSVSEHVVTKVSDGKYAIQVWHLFGLIVGGVVFKAVR